MIIDEDKKAEILEKLTIESCEKHIRHLLDEILKKAHLSNYGIYIDASDIRHYMDCMKVIREEEELIKAYPPK